MIAENTDSRAIPLWFESVHGMAGGEAVHLGEQAIFYPDRQLTIVERWGPQGNQRETFRMPEGIREKEPAILYLKDRCRVPSDALREILQEKQGPSNVIRASSSKAAKIFTGKQIVGFHYMNTGVFLDTYYHHRQEICVVSSLPGLGAKERITGLGCSWRSSGITPTLTGATERLVLDESTGQPVFQLRYLGAGQYELRLGQELIEAFSNHAGYFFVQNGKQIAYAQRINSYPWCPRDPAYEITPCRLVRIQQPLPVDTLLAILAFPMLQFGR